MNFGSQKMQGGATSNGAFHRPSFRLSDIWRAPLHDFPIRDEVLYQNLPLSKEMNILEIGPGSGFTAFRLARHVQHLTLIDVPENINYLNKALKRVPNLTLIGADVCTPGLAESIRTRFDAAFGLEVFELLPDPGECLRTLGALLKPEGVLLLQFPNYPPPKSPGSIYFRTMDELETLLHAAGFKSWSVYSLDLRPYAQTIYRHFHERPIKLYRTLRRNNGLGRPLTYDQSWAFQNRNRLEPYKVLLHLAWTFLFAAIRPGGNCFYCRPLGGSVLNHNLLVMAKAR